MKCSDCFNNLLSSFRFQNIHNTAGQGCFGSYLVSLSCPGKSAHSARLADQTNMSGIVVKQPNLAKFYISSGPGTKNEVCHTTFACSCLGFLCVLYDSGQFFSNYGKEIKDITKMHGTKTAR